jgi:hypothetical protein
MSKEHSTGHGISAIPNENTPEIRREPTLAFRIQGLTMHRYYGIYLQIHALVTLDFFT